MPRGSRVGKKGGAEHKRDDPNGGNRKQQASGDSGALKLQRDVAGVDEVKVRDRRDRYRGRISGPGNIIGRWYLAAGEGPGIMNRRRGGKKME
ncbi:hypothetical protein BO78DRAFT_119270 [Aspergillus sclerotiicarbonarius CBS 121057]|uniref:Uncharacterized protein n=1 Tax=Aspergillus sclerotiicarbonarius (strain CBS 121057 / IBT 28362) TaxID=1448318 RepID=A0A319EWK1_ASPSB|nr:hypothetical protein BO78DRAFT_119270 [Aspergillus sclerotiicarbonarius CBS 121057]